VTNGDDPLTLPAQFFPEERRTMKIFRITLVCIFLANAILSLFGDPSRFSQSAGWFIAASYAALYFFHRSLMEA